jgi:hypothetical protein
MNFYRNLIIIALTIIVSCKKDTIIVSKDDSSTKLAYDYWSNYQFEKRVYNVYKKSQSQLVFIYNDTLSYVKDSNIASAYKYYLQEYSFSNSKKKFLVGLERYDNFLIKLGKSTFPLYDLKRIKKGTNFNYISYNGYPYENRYIVKYNANFFEDYPSNFGKLQVVSSNIHYNSSFGGGNETNLIDFKFAKKYGLVEMNYYYSSQNINSQKILFMKKFIN